MAWLSRKGDPHADCRRKIEDQQTVIAKQQEELRNTQGLVKVVYFDPGPGQVMEPLQVLDAHPSEGGLVIRVAPYGLMPADARYRGDKRVKVKDLPPQVVKHMKRARRR